MKHRILLAALPILALASCATPETRLRTGLRDAGLSPKMSECMADRMVNELSLWQLRKISSLGDLKDSKFRELSVAEFIYKVRALKDPEILAETSKAAGACALGL